MAEAEPTVERLTFVHVPSETGGQRFAKRLPPVRPKRFALTHMTTTMSEAGYVSPKCAMSYPRAVPYRHGSGARDARVEPTAARLRGGGDAPSEKAVHPLPTKHPSIHFEDLQLHEQTVARLQHEPALLGEIADRIGVGDPNALRHLFIVNCKAPYRHPKRPLYAPAQLLAWSAAGSTVVTLNLLHEPTALSLGVDITHDVWEWTTDVGYLSNATIGLTDELRVSNPLALPKLEENVSDKAIPHVMECSSEPHAGLAVRTADSSCARGYVAH